MSVSEQEIESAAAIMEAMNRDGGNPSYAEMARAVLPILRPEGTRLVGECQNCEFLDRPTHRCDKEGAPTDWRVVSPDFGCVHYQTRESER